MQSTNLTPGQLQTPTFGAIPGTIVKITEAPHDTAAFAQGLYLNPFRPPFTELSALVPTFAEALSFGPF